MRRPLRLPEPAQRRMRELQPPIKPQLCSQLRPKPPAPALLLRELLLNDAPLMRRLVQRGLLPRDASTTTLLLVRDPSGQRLRGVT